MSSQHVLSWPITMCISACCLISSSTDAAGPGAVGLVGPIDGVGPAIIRPLPDPIQEVDEEDPCDNCSGWEEHKIRIPQTYALSPVPPGAPSQSPRSYTKFGGCTDFWELFGSVPIKTTQWVSAENRPSSNVAAVSMIETDGDAQNCDHAYSLQFSDVNAQIDGEDTIKGQWTLSDCPDMKLAKARFEASGVIDAGIQIDANNGLPPFVFGAGMAQADVTVRFEVLPVGLVTLEPKYPVANNKVLAEIHVSCQITEGENSNSVGGSFLGVGINIPISNDQFSRNWRKTIKARTIETCGLWHDKGLKTISHVETKAHVDNEAKLAYAVGKVENVQLKARFKQGCTVCPNGQQVSK